MKTHFIVNPVAGNGRGNSYLPELVKIKDAEVYIPCNRDDIAVYIRGISSDGDRHAFYAVGGDGTLNGAVNGAVGLENAAVGIIPAGTGNDFVRWFKNREAFNSVSGQLRGSVKRIDAVKAILDGSFETYFVNMANIGFDCNVVINASKIKNGIVPNSMAYVFGAVQELFGKWGQNVKIEFDDGTAYNGCQLLCTIANASCCGGGFRSSPYADIADGYIDAAVIDRIGRLKLMSLLKKYRDGTYLTDKHAKDFITYKKVRSMKTAFASKTSVSIDGEIYEFKRAEFKIDNFVNFIVPKGADGAGGSK